MQHIFNSEERNIYYHEELRFSYLRILSLTGLLLIAVLFYYNYRFTHYGAYFLESIFWIILLGLSALIHYTMLQKHPDDFWVARKLIPMALDFTVLTIMFIRFDSHGMFLEIIYLLLVMRIGLSYGKLYFYIALIMALASWATVYHASPYWQEHYEFLATFAAATFLVPFTYLEYIMHIHDERQELNDILDEIRYHSTLDTLTGAYNRTTYEKICEHLIKEQKPFALLYIDLNDFKQVNDQYGHYMGDQILQKVTDNFKPLLTEHDILARLGGDEFVILLSRRHHTVRVFIRSIETTVIGTYKINSHYIPVNLSIGISLYPENGHNLVELSSYADQAMYHAKQSKKSYYCFYDDIKSLPSASATPDPTFSSRKNDTYKGR